MNDILRREGKISFVIENYRMELFAQIQLNYYDWYQGTAKQQYEILRERSIPVMVMEPVHGGMLADLPEECLPYLPGKDASPAAWALRFVMNLPGVAVVLSGMSDLQQTEENVKTCLLYTSDAADE